MTSTPFEHIVVSILSRHRTLPSIREQLADLLATTAHEVDWELVLLKAFRERVGGLVLDQMMTLLPDLAPTAMLTQIDRLWEDSWISTHFFPYFEKVDPALPPLYRMYEALLFRQQSMLSWTASNGSETFAVAGPRALLIQGFSLLPYYDDRFLRDLSDVDVMIRTLSEGWQTMSLLLENGLWPGLVRLRKDLSDRVFAATHAYTVSGVTVNLHFHQLDLLQLLELRLDDVWERARPAPRILGQNWMIPSPEDCLVILLGNITNRQRVTLRDLNDYGAILSSTANFDWDYYSKVISQNGLFSLHTAIARTQSRYHQRLSQAVNARNPALIERLLPRHGVLSKRLPVYSCCSGWRLACSRAGVRSATCHTWGHTLIVVESWAWNLLGNEEVTGFRRAGLRLLRAAVLRPILMVPWSPFQFKSWQRLSFLPILFYVSSASSPKAFHFDTAELLRFCERSRVRHKCFEDAVALRISPFTPTFLVTPACIYVAKSFDGRLDHSPTELRLATIALLRRASILAAR
jgi:hypothetical protein